MYNDYFDIDAILAEEERIVSDFEQDAYNLGHLDQGSTQNDMPAGTKLELPFWLARTLNTNNIISNEPPVIYLEDYQNTILADPKVMSMKKHPYYDCFGIKISKFFRDYELSKFLFKAFKQRLFNIIVQSMNLRNTDISKIQMDLTTKENIIFALGYQTSADYDSWKNRKGDKIVNSDKKYTAQSQSRQETILKKRKRLPNND